MIDRISLSNFLAFQTTAIETRGLTLLSGANSSGKSSILHSLAVLRQSHTAGLLPGALLLNGDLVELGIGRDALHSDPIPLLGIDGPAIRIALEDGHATDEWIAMYDAPADVLQVPAGHESSAGGGLFKAGFQYLKADRIVPSVTYPKSHEAVTVQRFLGSSGQHSPNFLRVHGDSSVDCMLTADVTAPSTSLWDQTNAWLNRLSPGTILAVDDVEGTDYVRLSFRRAGPQVKTEAQRATNVGFGLTFALPVVVACLMARPGSLVLIENPEAHLHPNAQAELGRLCALAASGGAQFIVETHSDHVLNSIRIAVKRGVIASDAVSLQFFSREPNVLQPIVTTVSMNDQGLVDVWPRGFFDQWDQSLTELVD